MNKPSLDFDSMDTGELLARQSALWIAHNDRQAELTKLREIYCQILTDLLAIERALDKLKK